MLAAYINEVQALTPPQPVATTGIAPSAPAVSETLDKETNTECAFPPGKPRTRLNGTAQAPNSASGSTLVLTPSTCDTIDERVVKRSQTFSPSAVVSKNRYTCRLSRSDSDSAMHHFGGGPSGMQSFQRGATERRSLRFHSSKAAKASSSENYFGFYDNTNILMTFGFKFDLEMLPTIPRTSLDLELDLQAQHSKLETLNDEIKKLKDLKQR